MPHAMLRHVEGAGTGAAGPVDLVDGLDDGSNGSDGLRI